MATLTLSRSMSYQKTASASDTVPGSSSAADGIIDMETFRQILELDEDETHDFSSGMAWAYFAQARSTFDDMDGALYVIIDPRLLFLRSPDFRLHMSSKVQRKT